MAVMEPHSVDGTAWYAFPTKDWLDPFDGDEPRTQWFFVNQNRLSRAWVAPEGDFEGHGLPVGEYPYDVFTNPRSCLFRMEKLAVVRGGRVLREWTATALRQERVPGSCAQFNGLYYVLQSGSPSLQPTDAGHISYETALAAAVEPDVPDRLVMVARMIAGESLW